MPRMTLLAYWPTAIEVLLAPGSSQAPLAKGSLGGAISGGCWEEALIGTMLSIQDFSLLTEASNQQTSLSARSGLSVSASNRVNIGP